MPANAGDQRGDAFGQPRPGAGRACHRHQVDEPPGAGACAARSAPRCWWGRAAAPDRARPHGIPPAARPPRRGVRPARSARSHPRPRRQRRTGPRHTPSPGWRTSSAPAAPSPRRAGGSPARARGRCVIPPASARWPARWTVGPSASGSENGMPISIAVAPPRTAAVARRDGVAIRHQVDDERRRLDLHPPASRCSTESTSLSPRPDRPTITTSPGRARSSASQRA